VPGRGAAAESWHAVLLTSQDIVYLAASACEADCGVGFAKEPTGGGTGRMNELVELSAADESRLDQIKRDGKARRSRRYRRNAAFSALAVVGVIGFGSVVVTTTNREESRPQAARPADADGSCADSIDPACGPFRWASRPAPNQPLRAVLRLMPEAATAGEPVAGVVEWSDADAPRADPIALCWGDARCEPAAPRECGAAEAFGSWSPPPRRAGDGRFVVGPHSYTTGGRYTVSVTLRSSSWPPQRCPRAELDPFASVRTVRAEVVVR
jgi:hypothetical protein